MWGGVGGTGGGGGGGEEKKKKKRSLSVNNDKLEECLKFRGGSVNLSLSLYI